MLKKKHAFAALALVGVAALGLSACSTELPDDDASNGSASDDSGSDNGSSDQPSGDITLYTSEPEEKIDEVIDAFNDDYPDVNVKVYRAGTGEIMARINSEEKAGGVQADVLLAADRPTYEDLKSQDLLEKYVPSDTENFVDNMVDPDGYYVSTRIIPTVIAYNTDADVTPPTSWKDLTDSQYNGKIAMPSPDVSGAAAFNAAVWVNDPDLGEQWLRDLMANDPTVLQSNGPVSQAVAEGSSPIGVVVDYLVRNLADKGSPIDLEYPTDGVPFVSEPAGVFKTSENKDAAEAFVDFLVSEKGQKIAVDQSYLPIRTDVGTPEGAPEMDDIKLMEPDVTKIADQKKDAVELFDSLVTS